MSLRKQEKRAQFMKKFFVDVDEIEEIENDIDLKELERISDNEQLESREDILKERNKRKS